MLVRAAQALGAMLPPAQERAAMTQTQRQAATDRIGEWVSQNTATRVGLQVRVVNWMDGLRGNRPVVVLSGYWADAAVKDRIRVLAEVASFKKDAFAGLKEGDVVAISGIVQGFTPSWNDDPAAIELKSCRLLDRPPP